MAKRPPIEINSENDDLPMLPPGVRFVKPGQYAQAVGISYQSVYSWVKAGLIPAYYITPVGKKRRHMVIPASALDSRTPVPTTNSKREPEE